MILSEDWTILAHEMQLTDRLTDGEWNGKFAEKFAEFIGAGLCLPVSSCMAALHLSYMALGIGPGDEVICPAMSHVATAHAIELTGATPVFVDCDSNGNIHMGEAEDAVTRKTKAITLVHYNGTPCDMKGIERLMKSYGLRVIEDCALALGARYYGDHVGTFDIGCFSFYPSKHITTGEGGMFVCRDPQLYQKAKQIISFGKSGGAYNYDMIRLGTNYRMSEMQALLGILQMERVNDFISSRLVNTRRYREELTSPRNFILSPWPSDSIKESPYAFMLRDARDREGLMEALTEARIGFSVYYPHPIPRLKYYRDKYGYAPVMYPDAIKIADESIALPVGPHLSESDLGRVIDTVKGFYKGRG